MLLRTALVVFVVVTVVVVPPGRYRIGCYVTAGAYTAWAIGLAWLSQRGGERPVRLIWLALFVDLAVLTVLSLLAGQSEQSWTADILVNGFFVIPMIATAQLRSRSRRGGHRAHRRCLPGGERRGPPRQ